jgi:hypothetical protein
MQSLVVTIAGIAAPPVQVATTVKLTPRGVDISGSWKPGDGHDYVEDTALGQTDTSRR